MSQRYNIKVAKQSFEPRDLALRRASIGLRNAKNVKLASNWEGPYKILRATRTGAYALENLKKEEIPRNFNAVNLRRYYSLIPLY